MPVPYFSPPWEGDDTIPPNPSDLKWIYTVPLADLDILKPDGTDVPEADEETTGSVVLPRQEDGTLVTQLKLHKIQPTNLGGKYTLQVEGDILLWKDAAGTQAIDSETELDASVDTVIYAEATSGEAAGASSATAMTSGAAKNTTTLNTKALAVTAATASTPKVSINWKNTEKDQSLTNADKTSLIPVEIKTVTFSGTGCYQIRDIRDSFTDVSSKGYEDSTWTKDTQKGVLYVKESSPTLKVKLGLPVGMAITGKIKAEAYQGDGDTTKLTFEKDFSSSGGDVEISDLTTTDKLGKCVDNTNLRIKWSISLFNSGWNQFAETTNKLFLGFGTPLGERTYKRLDQICGETKGMLIPDPVVIVDTLHRKLFPQYGSNHIADGNGDGIWKVKEGLQYQCIDLTFMLLREMELLGIPEIPTKPIAYVQASWNNYVFDTDTRPAPTGRSSDKPPAGTEETLRVGKLTTTNAGNETLEINQFEACLLYANKLYPGGFLDAYDADGIEVLRIWLHSDKTAQGWFYSKNGIETFDELEPIHP